MITIDYKVWSKELFDKDLERFIIPTTYNIEYSTDTLIHTGSERVDEFHKIKIFDLVDKVYINNVGTFIKLVVPELLKKYNRVNINIRPDELENIHYLGYIITTTDMIDYTYMEAIENTMTEEDKMKLLTSTIRSKFVTIKENYIISTKYDACKCDIIEINIGVRDED